jgi:hypothetical protein
MVGLPFRCIHVREKRQGKKYAGVQDGQFTDYPQLFAECQFRFHRVFFCPERRGSPCVSGGTETVLMRGGHNPLAETHWTSLVTMLQLDST